MKKVLSMFVTVVMIFASVAVVPSAYAAAPKAITLSKTSQTVYIGQKYTLKVKAVTPKKADKDVKWKTSDKKIATVSQKGVVTGKKKGTVTITAVSKSNSKIKAKCKVTVKKFKTTTISHYSNIDCYDTSFIIRSNDALGHKDPHIIKTYSQFKALKKHIKKHYYTDDGLGALYSGKDILEYLEKYDKNYFKSHALYYNLIEFSTRTGGEIINYDFECKKVQKKINSKGKLTCYMYVKRKIASVEPSKHDYKTNTIDSHSTAYFIELNKKDIKGVQSYKLQHYEAIELEYIEVEFSLD